MLSDLAELAAKSSPNRSRVANGRLPEGIDGRSSWGRRYREVITSLAADLGEDTITSETARTLIMRAAAMTVEAERLEAKLASLGDPDPSLIELHGRTAGNLRRVLGDLRSESAKRGTPTGTAQSSDRGLPDK